MIYRAFQINLNRKRIEQEN